MMALQAYPAWLDEDSTEDSLRLVKRMLVVSLAVHVAALALAAGIRF